jgi:hypothetical protein
MTPGASGVYSRLSHWAVRAIRASGWVAAAFTCIGFGGSIVLATDLVSHFRVAYVAAILPALATYLPEIKRRKWPSALLAFALSLDVAVIAALERSGTGPILVIWESGSIRAILLRVQGRHLD